MIQSLAEQLAIRQAGELVVERKIIKSLRLLDVVERKADVAGEFRQQFHFFGVKEPSLGGVQRQDAHHLIRNLEGKDDERLQPSLPDMVFPYDA